MKAGMTSIIVGILVLLVLCPTASSDWTEPVPLTEVNTNYHDKSPFLSFDGLTLYFCIENGPWGWTTRIYQATRTEPAGPFTTVEEISTLNISGAHVADPWVSPDNLRMYYCRTGGGRGRLMVTTRASTNDPWLPGVEISELSALGNVYTPSLTENELTIVFCGDSLPGGQGGLDVWIATRPNTTSPFNNVRNLAEINSSAADGHSSISPDGLTLHFLSDRNSSGIGQLFKATRESLDAPFGILEHLSFFDSPGSSLGYPFLSSDGKAFYFAKVDGQPADIYVSYSYIPEPNQWSQPVPLAEVNTDIEEWYPFLPFDGLTLYFSRIRLGTYDGRIFKATRENPFGPFTSVSEITELTESGVAVLSPWVSPDNLRMYYDTEISGRFMIKFSQRTTVNDPWPKGTSISELNKLGNHIVIPRLTPDELTIFFAAYNIPGGKGGYDIWMATRPDRNSPFGNVKIPGEINTASADSSGFPSPDGLTLYFTSDRNGKFQLFKATRESLDAPFGNVEHLPLFDTPDGHSAHPCISNDGKAFYFVRSIPGASWDIWVSYSSEIPPPPPPKTYYVDGVNGSDDNNGLTPETAFATIQKGISSAKNSDKVLVFPAVYTEQIAYEGKAITVRGIATKAGIPILQMPDDFALLFQNGEGPDSVFKNFVIKNSFMAIFIAGSSPTIKNLTIVDNKYGIAAFVGSEPDISNCIFWNNAAGDLLGCQARYSWVQSDIEPQPIPGLVAYWSFDEGSGTIAHDSAGNNHGTIYGSTWTTGQIGDALNFDGDKDYVQVPDSDSLTPSSQITVCFWLYNRGGQVAGIYKYASCPEQSASPGNSRAYYLTVSENGTWMEIFSEVNTHDYITSSNPLSLNEWHHVAGTFNQGQAAIYVDGHLVNSRILSVSSIMNDAQPLIIGGCWEYCGTDGFESRLNGLADDVRIYNRALSSQEVLRLYQLGLSGSTNQTDPLFADLANGDYHLLSERGRYWPEHDVWVLDKVTSPCVDGGDPYDNPAKESMPNGGRIDIGAFGGTPFASMSDWPIDSDANHDGKVDLADLSILCEEWLSILPWAE